MQLDESCRAIWLDMMSGIHRPIEAKTATYTRHDCGACARVKLKVEEVDLWSAEDTS